MKTHIWQTADSEAAIEPEMPIIDPHHHLWGDGAACELYGRFLPEDLTTLIKGSGHRIMASVFAQCGWAYRTSGPKHMRCVGETEQVEAVAKRYESINGMCAGIMSTADLLLGDA